MAQAKTLTKTELKRVVDVTNSCSRYAARDVTMLLLTHLCGLRIGEVANLRIADVRDTDGTIRTEIRLDAERTKNFEQKETSLNNFKMKFPSRNPVLLF